LAIGLGIRSEGWQPALLMLLILGAGHGLGRNGNASCWPRYQSDVLSATRRRAAYQTLNWYFDLTLALNSHRIGPSRRFTYAKAV